MKITTKAIWNVNLKTVINKNSSNKNCYKHGIINAKSSNQLKKEIAKKEILALYKNN